MKKAFFVIFLFTCTKAFCLKYDIIDLGTLGGAYSKAQSINDSGHVVGYSYLVGNNDDTSHAFLYDGINMTDLGTLGGAKSEAYGINNSGKIVGRSYMDESSTYHAFLYDNGTMTDLSNYEDSSNACCINNFGQAVGFNYFSDSSHHAFLYNGTSMIDLGTLEGGNSWAHSINDNAQIVGNSYIQLTPTTSTQHAFLYENGTMTDLGTLGGRGSQAWGINNNGHVVGYSQISENSSIHAFMYDGIVMHDLGTLHGSSYAWGINDIGYIVGWSYTVGGEQCAFLYDGEDILLLQNLLISNNGWKLTAAYDINNLGQIVGEGTIGGETHAFLMTPIPEPTTFLLFVLGAILIRNS